MTERLSDRWRGIASEQGLEPAVRTALRCCAREYDAEHPPAADSFTYDDPEVYQVEIHRGEKSVLDMRCGMSELKPCLCGNDVLSIEEDFFEDTFQIVCSKCAERSITTRTLDDAQIAWNEGDLLVREGAR